MAENTTIKEIPESVSCLPSDKIEPEILNFPEEDQRIVQNP